MKEDHLKKTGNVEKVFDDFSAKYAPLPPKREKRPASNPPSAQPSKTDTGNKK